VFPASICIKFLNYPGLFESQLDQDGFFRSSDLGYLEGDRLFLRVAMTAKEATAQ
jgi:hypothetical protein